MKTDLSLQDIELIKVLAESGSGNNNNNNNNNNSGNDNNDDGDASLTTFLNGCTPDIKKQELFFDRICVILREYHRENTMSVLTGLTEKFSDAGITQDDAKAAISRARRLGAEI